jgi:outer membrane lipoprotein SlyB
MNKVTEQIGNLKSNPIGALAGVGAGYLVAKKLIKTDKMWMVVVVSVLGGVAGAMVQAKMKAKKGVPTATTVATANTK